MRKRIPCKIIRSVTLGKSDDSLDYASRCSAVHGEIFRTASLTYTARLAVTRTDIDDGFGARTLDFSV